MDVSILDYRDPVAGYISLTTDGSRVEFICRWPINRDENDWLTMIDRYDHGTYKHQIEALISNGRAQLIGKYGRVTLATDPNPHLTRIEIVLEAGRRTPIMPIEVAPRQLLPIAVESRRSSGDSDKSILRRRSG